MFNDREISFTDSCKAGGIYACSQCGADLFTADKKFEAGCGFPSFWDHITDHVVLNPLHTYGRDRVQLLCKECGQHLGHLFFHKMTPTRVRYCINEKAICLKKMNGS